MTASPVEIGELIARRLGATGALGTVAEHEDGFYTGRLVGDLLHGEAKARAPTHCNRGSRAAPALTATSITANAPPGNSQVVGGTVDVTVTGPGGTSATSAADQFAYVVPTATSLTPTVTPSANFVYNQQPSISVLVSPAAAMGTLTAKLDSTTTLAVTPGSGGNFSIALPATPLTVGSYTIALAVAGTGPYESSTGSVKVTVTTPALKR